MIYEGEQERIVEEVLMLCCALMRYSSYERIPQGLLCPGLYPGLLSEYVPHKSRMYRFTANTKEGKNLVTDQRFQITLKRFKRIELGIRRHQGDLSGFNRTDRVAII